MTDANGKILRVNNAFTEITGYAAEEVIGKNPRILGSGRHDQHFYAEMWKCVQRKGKWKSEIWNRRKNSEIYPEHLTITAVKNQNGIIVNYVATLTDISVMVDGWQRVPGFYLDPQRRRVWRKRNSAGGFGLD